jgi:hypothetical protein
MSTTPSFEKAREREREMYQLKQSWIPLMGQVFKQQAVLSVIIVHARSPLRKCQIKSLNKSQHTCVPCKELSYKKGIIHA